MFWLASAALVLSACGAGGQSEQSASTFKLPSDLSALTETRMIDRDQLFAEVILRYEDVEDTVIASRTPNTDVWQANLRLAGGHDYSLQLTWYDTVDGNRLDLVTFTRNFSAVFESGPLNFNFADYDFDGFDADDDGFVNLVERENGTSPLIADTDAGNDVQLCDGGIVLSLGSLCLEDIIPELELGFTQLALSARPGETASNTMVVSNTGTGPLNYTAMANQPWLQLVDDTNGNGVSGTLEAAESISLALQASCANNIEVRNGSISVESVEDGSEVLMVTLDCRGAILDVNPEFYQFAAEILPGASQTDSDAMTVSNSGNEALDFTISTDSAWLCPVNPANGSCEQSGFSGSVAAGDLLQVQIQGLCTAAPQMLAGNITLSSNGGTRIMPATMNCTLAPLPELSLLPTQITFNSMQSQQASGDLTISNPGTATLEFSVSPDQPWLQVANGQGTVPAGASTAVPLQAQCGDAVEIRSASLSVNSNAGNASVPVTLDCAALPAPMLLLQTPSIALDAEFSTSVDASFELTNTGSADLNFNLSSAQGWLQLATAQGTISIGDTVALSFQASCAAVAETRSGTIQIDSDGGNTSLPVTLQCTAPPTPELELQTTQLSLTALQNETATANVAFANPGTAELTYNLGSDSGWLQLSGGQGTLPAGGTAAVPLSASCDSEVQLRNGTINLITNAGNASVAVALDCQAIPQPVLSVETVEFTLAAEQNQQTAGTIAFANTGNVELGYGVSSDSEWLQLNSAGGSLAAGDSSTVTFTAVCGDQVELRNGSITFNSNGGGATVPVSLNCTAIPTPVLQISGAPLALAAQQDAAASGSFDIANVGTAALNYQIASDSGWLLAGVAQGGLVAGASTTVEVSASCDGLVETRNGSFTITSNGGAATVLVSLECSAIALPMLSLQTESLSLQALLGEAVPSNISIANTGNAELSFNVSSSEPWILLVLEQGTLAPGDSALLPLSASCDGQVESRFGFVSINSDGGSAEVPVTLNCSALPQPILVVSTAALTLQALQGELATASFEVSNAGDALLQYTASSDSAWLQVINADGELESGDNAVLAINAQCGDAVEQLNGTVSIDSNGGAEQIAVSLDCTAAPIAVLDVQPTLLTLIADVGQSANGTIALQNIGTASLSYSVSTDTDWLAINDASSGGPLELIAGESRSLDVVASCGLVAEVRAGSVTISSTAGDATVDVSLDCRAAVLRVEPDELVLEADITAAFGGIAQDGLAIFNDGTAELNFTVTSDSAWLCPDDPGSANCATNPQSFSASVLPGDFYSLPVAAECGDVEETRNGNFTIESNGGDALVPVTLACVSNGVPALQLTPTEFSEALEINVSSRTLLTVENIGTAPLTYDVSTDVLWLAVPLNSGTLAAGESASVEVEFFCANDPENLTGELVVTWDLDRQAVPFTLMCMGSSSVAATVVEALNNAALQGVQADLSLEDNVVAQTVTDANGDLLISGLPAQQGYSLDLTLSGYIAENYAAIDTTLDNTTFLQTIMLVDEQFDGLGTISGTIRDAITGAGVPNLMLDFRRGINHRTGPIVNSINTDNNGQYSIADMPAGNYTVEVSGSTHLGTFYNAVALGGQENSNQNASVSPVVLLGETRIVLTWGETPRDLDSHLTGPVSGTSDRFHVYYASRGLAAANPFAFLDLDDVSSFGPETITISQQVAGVYRYSVHDFSNRTSTDSNGLSLSGARVQVIGESGLLMEFNVPNEAGTLWTVFELNGDQIIPVNTMSFESNPSVIGSSGNDTGNGALVIGVPPK